MARHRTGRRADPASPADSDSDDDPSDARPDASVRRLCGQVARVLSYALGRLCGDEVLSQVGIDSVAPAPDAGRLRVAVRPLPGAEALAPSAILARLAAAKGFLRTEVASAIHRRRAPDLVFTLAPPEPTPPSVPSHAEDVP